MQGRVALAVLLVDVRAELEQQLRDAAVVVLARDVQERVLRLVLDLEKHWLARVSDQNAPRCTKKSTYNILRYAKNT